MNQIPEQEQSEFQDEPIYQDIISAITAQKLHPGTQLKEFELAKIYEVSRARIREVLLRLEHDQIVVRISNRGAFVAKPSIAEAREVFAARRLIEGRLVAQLATREYKSFIPFLKKHIAHEVEVRKHDDFANILHEGQAFHALLAEIANNSIITSYMKELLTRSSLICVLYQRGPIENCEIDEHLQLVDYIANGQAEAAEKLMIAHLDGIQSRLNLSQPREQQNDIRSILGAISK